MSQQKVEIRMMGEFSITVDGKLYDNLHGKTRKGSSLIQYLILKRGKPVAGYRLIRELWGDHKSENPESALKTMISRVRRLLNSMAKDLGECIVSSSGTYSWISGKNIFVDVN